jgi:SAM-dependent methyltransferase
VIDLSVRTEPNLPLNSDFYWMTNFKLNLGCGTFIKDGWLNHDLAQLPGVDVVHDLRDFPWPFEDGQFGEVYMKDVLEHLPDTIATMEELHRITSPGAKVYIAVPYWNSMIAFGDPTHVKSFNEFCFDFFDPSNWQCKERPYYSTARFHIRRMGVWVTPFEAIIPRRFTRDLLIFNPVGKKLALGLASVFCNVVNGLDLHLERA